MKIAITNSRTRVIEPDVLVAKSIKIYTAEFTLDEEWDGFAVTAVFENGGVRYEQPLMEGTSCVIPWEVLEKPGYLYISVYGIKGDQRRVSMVSGGQFVRSGAEPGEKTQEPTPDQYEQLFSALVGKQEKLSGVPGQVVGFDVDGNAVAQTWSGGGAGGTLIPATETSLGGIIVGGNLKITEEGVLSVDTADDAEGDNTRPITSAAVYTQIGNIEVLLGTI